MHPTFTRAALAAAAALCCAGAHAQTSPSPAAGKPDDNAGSVTIRGHYDNAVGTSDAASQGVIERELLKSRPALRPGEVLEFIPGLIVTQHSGDGKANQYFLRGFNLDHGTDFATRIDGMPVNMPTHAHGQGYTDLNFLIPELVQRIAYRKGPYFAANGDFASAGSADISYLKALDSPFGQLTLGGHNFRRGVVGGSAGLGGGLTLLGAVELQRNDGPWTVPEGLSKRNAVVSLSQGTASRGWSASLMGYSASWTATDQVPQRLIDAGSYMGKPFGRFDSTDPSSGGNTARSSLSAEWHADGDLGRTKVSAYAIHYRLDLNSNFTYSLDRPDAGDQFKQDDKRTVLGLDASQTVSHTLLGLQARSDVGLTLRQDRIRVGLFDTLRRRITSVVREDEASVRAAGVYVQTGLELTPWLRTVLGLRSDTARNSVQALTLAANGGRSGASQVSPKLSLVAGPFDKTEFFFNAGRGLHSNDARGTTTTIGPRSGEAVDRVPALAASRGMELGARTEAIRGLQSSLALWTLRSASELVYVGDAGTTEASGASTRRGVEFNNRYVPAPWFLLDVDLAWTHARFSNGDRIPNAIDRVGSVAATLRELGPWSASLQWRYLGPGALVEDNSVRSQPSLTSNLRLGYRLGPQADLTLDIFNLADRKVDDIQYAYDSRLPGEAGAVFDRHVHPAEPRTARLTLQLRF
jgi:hypothetical protein